MAEFLLAFVAFVAFVAAVLALSLGQLRGRGAVRGSCGGLSAIPGIESDCAGACRSPCERRRRAAGRQQPDQSERSRA
jgi:hypothetical protein